MGDLNELRWAIQNDDLEKVESIMESNSIQATEKISGRPLLCIAADYGHTDVIEYLIKKGAVIDEADQHGITPLLSAIYEDHQKCVEFLISKGAKKQGKAPDGSSYADVAQSDCIKNLLTN